MPLTQDINPKTGVYRAQCCGYDIALIKGEEFPLCAICQKQARWEAIRPVFAPKTAA